MNRFNTVKIVAVLVVVEVLYVKMDSACYRSVVGVYWVQQSHLLNGYKVRFGKILP